MNQNDFFYTELMAIYDNSTPQDIFYYARDSNKLAELYAWLLIRKGDPMALIILSQMHDFLKSPFINPNSEIEELLLDEAFKLDPANPFVNFYIGWNTFYKHNNPEKAISYLINSTKHVNCPKHWVYNLLSKIYFKIKDYQNTLVYIIKYKSVSNNNNFEKYKSFLTDVKEIIVQNPLEFVTILKYCNSEFGENCLDYLMGDIKIEINFTDYIKIINENEELKLAPGKDYLEAKERFQNLSLK